MSTERTDAVRLASVTHRAIRRRRAVLAVGAGLRWWGGALAIGGIATLLDVCGGSPTWMRSASFSCCVALTVVGIWSVVRAMTRRVDAAALLGAMERAWGWGSSELRRAQEFATRTIDDPLERTLASRVVLDVESRLATPGERPPIDRWGPVVRHGWGALVGVALLVSLLAWSPDAFGVVAQRLLHPWGDHPAWSATRLRVAMENERVLVGDGVGLVVEVEGQQPERVWIAMEGFEARIEAARGTAGQWHATVREIGGPVRVRAESAESRSRWVDVVPLELARITGVRTRVMPPEHARGLAPVREARVPIVATAGSEIELTFATSIPAKGVRFEGGDVVGDAVGRSVVVRRGVGTGGVWVVRAVTALGDGPDGSPLDVRVEADRAPEVRFVGEGVQEGALVMTVGERAVFGVVAEDDVALGTLSIDAPDGAVVREERVDHARVRATVAFDATQPGEFVVRATARDTVEGRGASEAELVVRVRTVEEAREEALRALDAETIASGMERAARAVGLKDERGALRALEELGDREAVTEFEREVADRAERLKREIEREGVSDETAERAEDALGDPAQRLRLADLLRRWAEALVSVTDEQVTLGAADSLDADLQGELRERVVLIEDALRRLGERVLRAPMDGERITALGDALRRERDAFEEDAAGWRTSDELRLRDAHDAVITDLHFAVGDMLASLEDERALAQACGEALRAIESIRALAGDEEGLGRLEAWVVGVSRQTEPLLPEMGASALWIAVRLDEMGVAEIMASAEGAMRSGDEAGGVLAREAGELLLSLREESDEREAERGSEGGDAPLSLSPAGEEDEGSSGSSESASSASSQSASSQRSALGELLDQLAANRRGDGTSGDVPEDAGEAGNGEGGSETAQAGGGGEGEGVVAGGSSVRTNGDREDAASEDDAVQGEEGVRSWLVEETLELTPGEAEALASVPERYRAAVAAYLRAISGREGGRIE